MINNKWNYDKLSNIIYIVNDIILIIIQYFKEKFNVLKWI